MDGMQRFGLTQPTDFYRKAERFARKFDSKVRERFPVDEAQTDFYRAIYIDWVMGHGLRRELPIEALCPFMIALQGVAVRESCRGDMFAAAHDLHKSIVLAVDETVPCFGLSPENAWYAACHLQGRRFGFAELVSQIVMSEMLSDEVVGITDPSAWRRHWRCGLL